MLDWRKLGNLILLLLFLLCKSVKSVPISDSFTSSENEEKRVVDYDNDLIDLSLYGTRIFGLPNPIEFEETVENPEELNVYLEGDLLIPTNQSNRNGILTQSSRWPRGIVPYEIRGQFSPREWQVIRNAFHEYHVRTCIRFQPRRNEKDYIIITSEKTGCWSSVGRLGGIQYVNLQAPMCLKRNGTTIHELMHALGFFHEQNRYERDNYVKVMTQNVQPTKMINFQKTSPRIQYGFGVPYDYASVLHYSPRSFSRNGKNTLVALRNTNDSIYMGQRIGLSTGDVRKINSMYRCKR